MTIAQILHEAGISRDAPEYGLQFNLTHASLDPTYGARAGLNPRVLTVIERHHPELFTPEARHQQSLRFVTALLDILERHCGSIAPTGHVK